MLDLADFSSTRSLSTTTFSLSLTFFATVKLQRGVTSRNARRILNMLQKLQRRAIRTPSPELLETRGSTEWLGLYNRPEPTEKKERNAFRWVLWPPHFSRATRGAKNGCLRVHPKTLCTRPVAALLLLSCHGGVPCGCCKGRPRSQSWWDIPAA